MSDFWWNLLPQYWHGYGLVSECMSMCVDNVDDLLNVFPHCLHSNDLSCECTARCWLKLTAWPKVLWQMSQAKGRLPLCERRTWTSSPCGVLKTFPQSRQVYVLWWPVGDESSSLASLTSSTSGESRCSRSGIRTPVGVRGIPPDNRGSRMTPFPIDFSWWGCGLWWGSMAKGDR